MKNLTEQEVGLLEKFRKLDEQGKFEALVMLGRMEKQQQIRTKLEDLIAAMDILKTLVNSEKG